MRILLVEDDRPLAGAIKRGLEAEGFAVDLAATGDEGLWLATEFAYDVMILDIMLPGINGYELCEKLRSAGTWTPILMLTAMDGELDEAEALDIGADDFLAKPFSFVVLVARLRALLRRGQSERPSILAAGDLKLDPAAHKVWRDDTPIALTPRQFALLEFLLRRAGEVVPKAEILGHVWDFAFAGDPNIVEVYIAQLRKAIDQPFGRNSLQTVRLVGYRLDPDGG
jgi:two-component system, OmpR family, response regulator